MLQASQPKPRILLVDDDAGLLKLLTGRLAAAGYEVTGVETGSDALGCLDSFNPQLIVADLHTEEQDTTLLRAVREHDPALPVIIVTANGSIPAAVAATRNGAFNFLTRPVDSGILIKEIRRALELSPMTAVSTNGRGREPEGDGEFITRSPIMRELLKEARLVAESEASVLICGESGTGKELLARAIHKASSRRDQPFVAINCSAIPEPLLESELFGYRKGSFTGATRDHRGLFDAADRGTLFLDEIGDMPLALQPKLLRVLEERQVRRLGATEPVPVDVRIISATHQDLEAKMREGEFREDLYYRLNVVKLELPPLGQRPEDIPLLAAHFVARLAEKYHKEIKGFSPEAMELLAGASWPGNVRQLLNVVEHAVTLSPSAIIPAMFVQRALRDRRREMISLAEAKRRFEREYLTQLLQITSGNVSQAARLAKRNRTEFYKLLHRHCLDPALFKSAR
jgi:two-component system, NtrC family, response regulator GlrR